MISRKLLIVAISFICTNYGPPNCNLYKADARCYKACNEAEMAITFAQGSRKSQEHFDKSIQSCPSFDYSHYEKAVPYAKRGLMKEWKVMIDEAVRLDPKEHLGTRGWYHFFFMHNYEAAIKDIEKLDSLIDYNIGFTGDADYHLNIMKALCWKGLGKTEKAITIIHEQMAKKDHDIGLFDYLHLGVLYLEMGNYENALEILDKQIEINNLSEIYFYKALCYKQLNIKDEYKSNLEKALKLYKRGSKMSNPYRELVDEIYLSEIENEITIANK
ncbi:MAG: tetratricopeptide repeat protein [Saprospiraceae bacterium]|nr:tetratricopeptide repeat protein [Saprospiraceae bacterium]